MTAVRKPEGTRPYPLEGYGIPESSTGLLPWEHVSQRMAAARTYWVCTLHPDGHPHVRPVWGVWVEETLYVGGGPNTRWSRNLRVNPQLSVHLEDGSEAVIFEGSAEYITDDADTLRKTDDAYIAKYNIPHGPVWRVTPLRVYAWTEYPTTVTRWLFDVDEHEG